MSHYNLRSGKTHRRSKSVPINFLNNIELNNQDLSVIEITDDSEESFNEASSDVGNLFLNGIDNKESKDNVNIDLKEQVIKKTDIRVESFRNNFLNNNLIMAFDSKFAMRMIPSMSNKDDLHKFCRCVDVIWEPIGNNNVSKALCLNIIISKLEKTAYDVVRYKTFVDWPTLKTALENKFIKRRSKGSVASELINAVQFKDVTSFSNKIENLLGELNEICIASEGNNNADIIMKLNESTALCSFQNGLREPLRTIIKSRNFDNLSSAIAQAMEEEVSHKPALNAPNNSNSSKPKCSYCNRTNHVSEKCFRKHGNSNSNLNVSNSNQNKSFPNSNQKSNNFQSSSQLNQSSQMSNQNVSNVQTSIICAYCKESGHFISSCYKKKFNDLKNSQSLTQNSSSNNIQNIALSSSENFQQPFQTPSTSVRVQDLSALHE